MKTSQQYKYIFSILVLILGGCTYEPDEVFFQEITEPEHRITFSLNEHDERDTIYLFGPADFTFNVGITPGKIEIVNVNLDEGRISPRSSNRFSIDQHMLKTGTYKLTIEFISTSGSGSLLDAVGGEKVRVWRTWIVKIDVSPPPKPRLTLTSKNGFLKLNWTPYTKPNFIKYALFVGPTYDPSEAITFTDAAQTSWIDSAYVGGRNVSYTLYTYAVGTASDHVELNDELGFTVDYTAVDSTATIRWNKTSFPSALESVELYENNVLRQVITNPADTTVALKLDAIWNMISYIGVKYKAKYSSYSPEYERYIPNTVVLPKMRVGFEELYYSSATNAIVAYRDSHLVLFDSELQPTDSVPAQSPFFVPYSGPYVYFQRNGGAVVRHNLFTDEQISVGTFTRPKNIQGTENGLVSYMYSLSYDSRSRVYDYDNDTYIEKSEVAGVPDEWINPSISTKGKFLFFPTSHQVHEINGTTTSPLGTLNNGHAFQSFRPDNDDEMIVDGNIYDSQTLQWKRRLTPSGGDYDFLDYDPVTGYAIFGDFGTVGIHAVHVETLEVKVIPAFYKEGYRLVAGYLFDKDHKYIKVF